jgi:adenine-specific DNA-methyltransferase
MKKDKLGSSLNKQEEILNFLKSDLPEVFSEGKIDCKKLKQTLGEEVDDSSERYGLSWAGKSGCFQTIQEQTTATLKPVKDESVNFDIAQNIFIEGDNLEVLKVLQRSYYGKVKMIYIDPPYNTGGDFIYNDNFRKSKKDELVDNGEMDNNGDLTRVDGLSLNRKDSNGHFHSDWLNMMYPRLFLARNLLRQDGVIFVSIDDNESHNLRLIMNEIFGEENFISEIVWEKRFTRSNNAKKFATLTERVLLFRKSDILESLKEPRGEKADSTYSNPDNDERGVWTSVSYVNPATKKQRPNLTYDLVNPITGDIVKHPTNAWKYSREVYEKHIKENKLYWGREGKNTYPRLKRFLFEMEGGMVPVDLWSHKTTGTTDQASKELYDLMGAKIFDFPKPVGLIKRMLSLITQDEDIVLDFFAGSGATAQAVMEQNIKDESNRKWICVQLPELCDENTEAYKAGYKTIAEISKERIKRAGKKIGKENETKVDLGFKVLKLDKSNFKVWQGKFENTGKLLDAMAEFVDNVEKGSNEENILFELFLKSGLDLNVPIEIREFDGSKYYVLDNGKLIIYLGNKITKELSEEIQKSKPEKFICLDGCFQNNDQLKTNISLQMEQEKIDFKVI